MTDDPAFLTLTQVEALHRLAMQRHGGQEGVRDPAGLESAVMHPLNVWLCGQGDLLDVAAAYAFHIAQSQAYLDGNKRTAVGAALTFLEGNGVEIPEATDAIYRDPIGEADGYHLYAFCANNPVRYIDAYGRDITDWTWVEQFHLMEPLPDANYGPGVPLP